MAFYEIHNLKFNQKRVFLLSFLCFEDKFDINSFYIFPTYKINQNSRTAEFLKIWAVKVHNFCSVTILTRAIY